MKIIETSKIKEKAYVEELENGLKVIIIPKKNTKKKYVIWGTHFGSIDNHFIMPKTKEEIYIPDGVAHFLEHKMFEQPNGTNSLDTLMALGIDANAYTTNDHTAYLFECTNHFEEGLNELMDYVQHPYFTEENVEKEKGIKKECLLEAIENALITAYKRNFDSSEENVKVTIDSQTGEVHVYAIKDVVETIEHPDTQILLADAQNIDRKLMVGDKAEIELAPKNFGRIAAQTAKQVVIQRIKDAERDIVFDEYVEREKEIITGLVQRKSYNNVYVDLGSTEAILPYSEQISGESYNHGDRYKMLILSVEKSTKGPQIVLSRSHPDLIKRLFELEIPEVSEGIVEIYSISREAGSRTKIAVFSRDPEVDPLGACVGYKGQRVNAIVDEIDNEKIDIVIYEKEIDKFIANSLSPSKVEKVFVNEAEKSALAIVPDYQLSLAIGKEGQNVRLAAKLTGWKIDIKSNLQFEEYLEERNITEEDLIEEYENAVKECTEEVLEDANSPEEQDIKVDEIEVENSIDIENYDEESSLEETEI